MTDAQISDAHARVSREPQHRMPDILTHLFGPPLERPSIPREVAEARRATSEAEIIAAAGGTCCETDQEDGQ